MGDEIGQWREWNHDSELQWEVLGDVRHAGLQQWVRDLNRVYSDEPSLWEVDYEPEGFDWIDCHDHENSVVSFLRRGRRPGDITVVLVNFTPLTRHAYRIGVPRGGRYRELLNSDAGIYGGSNAGNQGSIAAEDQPSHGHAHSLILTLPPLGFLLLKPEEEIA